MTGGTYHTGWSNNLGLQGLAKVRIPGRGWGRALSIVEAYGRTVDVRGGKSIQQIFLRDNTARRHRSQSRQGRMQAMRKEPAPGPPQLGFSLGAHAPGSQLSEM